MSERNSNYRMAPTTTTATRTTSRSFLLGLRLGFIPLALVLGVLLLATVVTAVARAIVGTDFTAQQSVLPLVFGLGLVAAFATYAVGVVIALRRIRRSSADGQTGQASGGLLALTLSALLMLLPFVLAFVLPQSPAVAK